MCYLHIFEHRTSLEEYEGTFLIFGIYRYCAFGNLRIHFEISQDPRVKIHHAAAHNGGVVAVFCGRAGLRCGQDGGDSFHLALLRKHRLVSFYVRRFSLLVHRYAVRRSPHTHFQDGLQDSEHCGLVPHNVNRNHELHFFAEQRCQRRNPYDMERDKGVGFQGS